MHILTYDCAGLYDDILLHVLMNLSCGNKIVFPAMRTYFRGGYMDRFINTGWNSSEPSGMACRSAPLLAGLRGRFRRLFIRLELPLVQRSILCLQFLVLLLL